MRSRTAVSIVGAMLMLGTGAALAGHVGQVDPASVPTGFLVTHNPIEDFGVAPFARAARSGEVDVFLQHVRLPAHAATGWHTHPGPVIVSMVRGSLTFQDAHASECRNRDYAQGSGFVDEGFGHVHRAMAGPAGADFYAVYVLPAGSPAHAIAANAPEECTA
jgi:quercetin dioxygenase-like cupin family protein